MVTLVIDERLVEMFRHRVVPVLQAKAAAVGGSSDESMLDRLIGDPIRLWTVELSRPRPGDRFRVAFDGRSRPRVHGARVFMDGDDERPNGATTVVVTGSYGEHAVCVPAEGEERHGEPESHRLLCVTCPELTLLADILPGKDCLHAVATWANELTPLSYVVQRPRKPVGASRRFFDVRFLRRDHEGFGILCDVCSGSALVDCRKCQGSGIYESARTCDKCSGESYLSSPDRVSKASVIGAMATGSWSNSTATTAARGSSPANVAANRATGSPASPGWTGAVFPVSSRRERRERPAARAARSGETHRLDRRP